MPDDPSYASPPLSTAQPRLSPASIASLVLGIVLCIPFVTSLLAILFGIKGIRTTRNATFRGRGLAVSGLTLGIVGTLAWATIGCFTLFIILGSQAPRAALHEFARDITSGNLAAAATHCDPIVTPAQLEYLHAYIVPFGTYEDLTCSSINLHTSPSGPACNLTGQMQFSSGSHAFSAVLIKDTAGAWKIYSFHVM